MEIAECPHVCLLKAAQVAICDDATERARRSISDVRSQTEEKEVANGSIHSIKAAAGFWQKMIACIGRHGDGRTGGRTDGP